MKKKKNTRKNTNYIHNYPIYLKPKKKEKKKDNQSIVTF